MNIHEQDVMVIGLYSTLYSPKMSTTKNYVIPYYVNVLKYTQSFKHTIIIKNGNIKMAATMSFRHV